MTKLKWVLAIVVCFMITNSYAETLTVKMYQTRKKGHGKYFGDITFEDTSHGLLIKPHFKSLPPGLHGFHVHQNPSCENLGLAAGGHYDPQNTGKHLGPYNNDGHLGDLPALYVNKKGQANLPVLAPRLTVDDLHGHALIIHVGGDNYSDIPKKLGGGGPRLGCGVVQ